MGFCTFNTCWASIAIIFCVAVLLTPYALRDIFLCLGGSTFTIVFSNFFISYMSLLLVLAQLEIAVMVVWYHTCLCCLLSLPGARFLQVPRLCCRCLFLGVIP